MIRWNGPGPQEMTPGHLLAITRAIRAAFDRHGIRVAGSTLEDDLRGIEEVASSGVSLRSLPPTGTPSRASALRAYGTLPRAQKMAAALLVASCLDGFRTVLRRLPGLHIEVGPGPRSQAWDLLYEVEVAAQIHLGGEDEVRFGEPDLQVRSVDPGFIAVACKRTSTDAACRGRMQDALDQVRAAGMPGMFVINTDQIVGESMVSDSREQAGDEIERRLDQLVQRVAPASIAWTEPSVVGTNEGGTVGGLLTAGAHALYGGPPGGNRVHQLLWRSRIVKNPRIAGSVRRVIHRALGRTKTSLCEGHSALLSLDLEWLVAASKTALREVIQLRSPREWGR
jgi:hypothetical protein